MKQTIAAIAAVVKVASVVLGLASYSQMIPEKFMPLALLAFTIASASKEVGIVILDYLDDGKRNNSYKLPIIAGALLCFLPSCGTTASGEKTFIGITAAGWANVGKSAAVAAVPVALNERAKNSAKNPITITP